MLTGSMMISPLSYTRTYAAENEQQYETNLQETVEVEEADLDKKQDESQTEDAGNVKEDKRNDDLTKEDQTEESDKEMCIRDRPYYSTEIERLSENCEKNRKIGWGSDQAEKLLLATQFLK